ncbi:hypothetical protein PGTUg99_019368 [Puccinia graminis f. sp. tritici]|uniref:Uncharacterized protein n=1 Tax=Puccinia graminis f. sp. tritici TaxID=56615 RepID=A0A5B0MT96_PUCGR|nr:hypothetical protein PGTUg99_019368 [Puccinia graminis f. sp. tritici]
MINQTILDIPPAPSAAPQSNPPPSQAHLLIRSLLSHLPISIHPTLFQPTSHILTPSSPISLIYLTTNTPPSIVPFYRSPPLTSPTIIHLPHLRNPVSPPAPGNPPRMIHLHRSIPKGPRILLVATVISEVIATASPNFPRALSSQPPS